MNIATRQLSTDSGGDGFAEARKIAALRQILQETPDVQGPEFKQPVWEYYMVKATWSDGLCVALNHASMYGYCFCPLLWPVRLCQTISRASPLKVKCCKCFCPMNRCCGPPVVTIIFLLPILAASTFVPQISKMMQEQFVNIPVLKDQPNTAETAQYVSMGLVGVTLFLLIFWWARILLGVGMKYKIALAMDKPDKFVLQAMCCICATNMRAGVHVDRAQGFMKVDKKDKLTIELSEDMRMRSPPAQNILV